MPNGIVGGALAAPLEINNPLHINITEAANGFIVRVNNKRDWNERQFIAPTIDDVLAIIKDKMAAEGK